ncbi:hypothetical protein ACFSTH_17675 [Paenibacillus yanchengensis]|uniref:Uncharacterized protein n=1 Tax=Paenibacillus yanchengensis TaxID=2035833 RepID=A0ABW4YQ79_9BACL
MTKTMPSKNFPGLEYEAGVAIWLDNLLPNHKIPFYFHISESITQNEHAITRVADVLDQMDELVNKAKRHLNDIFQINQLQTMSYYMIFLIFTFLRWKKRTLKEC